MPLVCEISIEAYCRRNDVIRRLIIGAPNRMSPNVTNCAQFRPINNAFFSQIGGLQRQTDVM
jgi:hypothetical protein